MKSQPLVSIGLPVFNGEDHLPEALDSLLVQDHRNLELVISDNASTDRTPEICRRYAKRDRRIRYFRNVTNTGMLANFYRVLDLSTGPYFMWAGHHDRWERSFVRECLRVLEREPRVVLCYSRAAELREAPTTSFGVPRRRGPRSIPPRQDAGENVDTRGLPPAERVVAALRDCRWFLCVYGVWRTEVVRACKAPPTMLAPDVQTVVAASLVGEIARVEKTLFHFRVRPDAPDAYDQQLLRLDPRNWERRLLRRFVHTRFLLGVVSPILRSRMPWGDRLRLARSAARTTVARWGGDLQKEWSPLWDWPPLRRLARRLTLGR